MRSCKTHVNLLGNLTRGVESLGKGRCVNAYVSDLSISPALEEEVEVRTKGVRLRIFKNMRIPRIINDIQGDKKEKNMGLFFFKRKENPGKQDIFFKDTIQLRPRFSSVVITDR